MELARWVTIAQILSKSLHLISNSHKIQSNVWNSFRLLHLQNETTPTETTISMSEAIRLWLAGARRNSQQVLRMQDNCQGARCNSYCPEQVVLGETSPSWPLWCQAAILGVVIAITVVGMATKFGLGLWELVSSYRRTLFWKIAGPVFSVENSIVSGKDSLICSTVLP